jgi:hypothetical protein
MPNLSVSILIPTPPANNRRDGLIDGSCSWPLLSELIPALPHKFLETLIVLQEGPLDILNGGDVHTTYRAVVPP